MTKDRFTWLIEDIDILIVTKPDTSRKPHQTPRLNTAMAETQKPPAKTEPAK